MKLARFFFYIFILLLPFDGSFDLLIRVGFISFTPGDLFLIPYILLTLMFSKSESWNFLSSKLALLMIGLIIFCLPPMMWGKFIQADIKVFLKLILFFALFYSVMATFKNIKDFKVIFLFLVISSIFFSILTVLKALNFNIPGGERTTLVAFGPFILGRYALSDHAGYLGIQIIFTTAIILFNVLTDKLVYKLPLLALFYLAAFLPFSRSIWLALILQLLIFFFLKLFTERKKKISSIPLSFFIVIITISFLIIFLPKIINLRPETVEGRFMTYKLGIQMVLSNIFYVLFGTGRGNFLEYAYNIVHVPVEIHNTFFQLFITRGIFFLMIFFIIILTIFFQLTKLLKYDKDEERKKYYIIFILAIIGIIIESLSTPMFTSVLLWTCFALANTLINIVKNERALDQNYHQRTGKIRLTKPRRGNAANSF